MGSNRRLGVSYPQLVMPVAHHELEIPESAPLNWLDHPDRRTEMTAVEQSERDARWLRATFGNQLDHLLPQAPIERPAVETSGDKQAEAKRRKLTDAPGGNDRGKKRSRPKPADGRRGQGGIGGKGGKGGGQQLVGNHRCVKLRENRMQHGAMDADCSDCEI